MARIAKTGLDYFPTDVTFLQCREMKRLSRKHGAIAPVIMIGVYSITYGEKGYYMEWNEDVCFDLSELANTGTKEVHAVLHDAIKIGFFDEGLFEEHRILTSESIQKQYLACTQKRKAVVIEEKYRLSSSEALHPVAASRGLDNYDDSASGGQPLCPARGHLPSTEGRSKSAAEYSSGVPGRTQTVLWGEEMTENGGGMQQSKEKESKGKKSIAQQTTPISPPEMGGDPKDPEGPEAGRPGSEVKKMTSEPVEEMEVVNGRKVPRRCLNKRTHNYDGLLERLNQIHITDVKEVNKILEMSDYGKIGHPLWGIISYNNWPRGNTIKFPGRFVVSQLKGIYY